MKRLNGNDAKWIALYALAAAAFGLTAGFAFGYGKPAGGVMFTIAALIMAAATGGEVKVRREGK